MPYTIEPPRRPSVYAPKPWEEDDDPPSRVTYWVRVLIVAFILYRYFRYLYVLDTVTDQFLAIGSQYLHGLH